MKKIIIANWKMNLGLKDGLDLAREIVKRYGSLAAEQLEVVICPSFTSLDSISNILHQAANIQLGAQDVFWEERGSFTGEISPSTLKELGCRYAIIGHSERRQYLAETNSMVHKKVKVALSCGLCPIICVGESFDERQKGQKDYVIMNQVNRALDGLDLAADSQLVIAYEPIWVIGSGQAIKPEEAKYTNQLISSLLREIFSENFIKNHLKIIYGGSVDQSNVADFTRQPNVDGVLVGGASLKAEEFIALIEAVIEAGE